MTDDIDIVDRLRIAWTSMTEIGNAERERAADEIERLRSVVQAWQTYSSRAERDIAELREERDEARMRTGRILNEIDCRIEHGAESNGHLEAIRNLFKKNADGR